MSNVRTIWALALVCTFAALATTVMEPRLVSAGEDAGRRDDACPADERAASSQMLQVLYEEDQGKRPPENGRTNEQRREAVSEIFAKGCFDSGQDFFNAALIFQHGTVPEHYLQAYYWALAAKARGFERAEWLIPRAADRYLMSIGHRQLFATNLISNKWFNPEEPLKYWCLWPVEDSFPKARRDEYAGEVATLDAQLQKVRDMNNGELPAFGAVCDVDAQPSPAGSLPGLW